MHMRFKYASATASLRRLDSSVPWVLSRLISEDPGKGHATRLMEDICDYADKHQIDIQLMVNRFKYTDSKALDNNQLRAFYEKFGFEWDGEKNLPLRMVREPRKKNTALNEREPEMVAETRTCGFDSHPAC